MIDVERRVITADEGILFQKVEDMELCVRAQNCLCNANVRYVGELIQMTYEDLRAIKNLGRRAIADVSETLAVEGLCLGMTIKGWGRAEFKCFLAKINNPCN